MRLFCLIVSLFFAVSSYANNAIKYYEQALALYHAKDIAAAEIEVKNSLKQDKNYLPARILLAEIQVSLGNLNGAEKEYQKALTLKADPNAVVFPLVEVKLALQKVAQAQQLLAQYSSLQVNARFYYLRASAYKAQLAFTQAKADYQQAIALQYQNAEVYTGLADLYYQQNDIDAAKKQLHLALTAQADYFPALLLSSEVDKSLGDYGQAQSKLAKILAVDDKNKQALFAQASLYLAQSKLPEALTIAVMLKELAPEDPYAKLLHATLIAQQGHSKEARRILVDISQQISGIDDKYKHTQQVLLLSATVDFINQNPHSAKKQFLRYLELYSDDATAYRYLAIIAFREGNMSKAAAYVEKSIAINPNDSDVYLIAGQIYQQANLPEKQLARLKAAHERFSNVQQIQDHYLSALLAQNKYAQALDILASSNQNNSLQNKTLLAYMQLQSGLYEQAHQSTQALLDSHADKVEILQLAGELSLKTNTDIEQAKYFFEQALVLDEGFAPAQLALAGIALQANNWQAVEQHYKKVLDHNPNNTLALQLYADLAIKQQRFPLAIKLLEPMANENNYQTGNALLNLYLLTNELEKAQALLALLEQNYALDHDLLLTKSRIQAKLEQVDLAKKTLKILFGLVYEQPNELAVLAQAQLDIGDISAAKKTISRLDVISTDVDTSYLLTQVYLADNNYEQVEKLINANLVKEKRADKWHMLKVRLLIAQYDIEQAIALLETIYAQQESRQTMQWLSQLYAEQQQADKLIKLLATWLKRQANDAWAVAQLSSVAISQDNLALAIETLQQYPNLAEQPLFLNNLANYYFRQSRQAQSEQQIEALSLKALNYAKQAYKLAPENAAINDTLGWITVNRGQVAQGLGLLREASARDSQNGEVFYHLAYALAKADNFSQAKLAFEKAVQLAPEHPLLSEVKAIIQH